MVEDVNDHAPIIETLPPAHIPSTAPIGTVVTSLTASDADGSRPNNQV